MCILFGTKKSPLLLSIYTDEETPLWLNGFLGNIMHITISYQTLLKKIMLVHKGQYGLPIYMKPKICKIVFLKIPVYS